jgi:N-acetylneuraminate synthase
MPPYPWLQGGTAYHNIFTSFSSIQRVLQSTGLKLCLDTSHTYLACNLLGDDFYKGVDDLLDKDLIGHLHVSDADSTHKEGIMIGEGSIDFTRLFKAMHRRFISFIPEVWEGHINAFSGFSQAIDRLSDILDDLHE